MRDIDIPYLDNAFVNITNEVRQQKFIKNAVNDAKFHHVTGFPDTHPVYNEHGKYTGRIERHFCVEKGILEKVPERKAKRKLRTGDVYSIFGQGGILVHGETDRFKPHHGHKK